MKVLKFGGTSCANASSLTAVKNVVLSSKDNRVVVVSAPGKREKADIKVTDLLYACFDVFSKSKVNIASLTKKDSEFNKSFATIEKRFIDIIADLKLNVDLSNDFRIIKDTLIQKGELDYFVSRGEFLSGKIMASILGYDFIDPSSIVKFDKNGKFLPEETNEAASKILLNSKAAVIPGFYGALPNGTIKTFSRGGSDVTGAILARAVNASVYENWTDVDGFLVTDPRIVNNPKRIEMLTYRELRELSYMGASVLHSDSIFPVRKSDIPIHIRNTFCPSCTGTLVVPTGKYLSGEFKRQARTVTGIAGKKDICAIYIRKAMMNDELGFARRVLEILEKNSISLEQMPSGIDTLTVVFDSSKVSVKTIENVRNTILSECQADEVRIKDHLAIIAVVGHGMNSKRGTAAKVCGTLSDADINIVFIDQGSSELNIILGINETDYEKAIVSLHEAFKDD